MPIEMAALRVHRINTLTLCRLGAKLVNGEGGLVDRTQQVRPCLLVKTTHELALVDTGIGTDPIAAIGRLGLLLSRSRRPGMRPSPKRRSRRQAHRAAPPHGRS